MQDRIGIRINEKVKSELVRVCGQTGRTETAYIKSFIEALVKAKGAVQYPIELKQAQSMPRSGQTK